MLYTTQERSEDEILYKLIWKISINSTRLVAEYTCTSAILNRSTQNPNEVYSKYS